MRLIYTALFFWAGTLLLVTSFPERSALADDVANNESEVSRQNVQHLFDLAFKYDNGLGVPLNRAKAAAYYRQAAEKKHVQSMFYLALLYQRGDGVPRNLPEAYKWIHLAEEGYPSARLVREEIESAMYAPDYNQPRLRK